MGEVGESLLFPWPLFPGFLTVSSSREPQGSQALPAAWCLNGCYLPPHSPNGDSRSSCCVRLIFAELVSNSTGPLAHVNECLRSKLSLGCYRITRAHVDCLWVQAPPTLFPPLRHLVQGDQQLWGGTMDGMYKIHYKTWLSVESTNKWVPHVHSLVEYT